MPEVQEEEVQRDNLGKKIALQLTFTEQKVASHVLDVSGKEMGLVKFCNKSNT